MNAQTASAMTWSMTQQPRLKARRIGQPDPVSWCFAEPARVETTLIPSFDPPPFRRETLAEVERRHVLETLRANRGVRTKAAKDLGIGVRTLFIKLKAWGYAGVKIP